MSNITKQILDIVTIPDILTKYGYELGNRNRIPCPIHHGKDRNFCYEDRVFHCWVCEESGNAIDLVAQLFDINEEQAEIRINNDFNLNLTNEKPTYRDKIKAREMARRRAEQIEKSERGRAIYNQLTRIRRELFQAHGDDCEQVLYLDRLLDRYSAEPSPLTDWQIDLENLEINLKGCADHGKQNNRV